MPAAVAAGCALSVAEIEREYEKKRAGHGWQEDDAYRATMR
jgi:hypothetical protein